MVQSGKGNVCILDWAFVIVEIFHGCTKRYTKKVAELPYHLNFDIKVSRDNLKSLTSCSELVPDSCNRMLENQGFVKEAVFIEKEKAGKSNLCRKRVVEVLKRQIEIRPGEITYDFE